MSDPQPQKIVCELMGTTETPFAADMERFVISLSKGGVVLTHVRGEEHLDSVT